MQRILIVEDEQRLAAFVEKGLQRGGFQTEVVTNGQDALVRSQDADLMLLDLGLPHVSGWEVLKALKSQVQGCPVIVMTAQTDVEQAARKAGAADYVAKPFRFQDLLAAVKAQLPEA